MFLRGTGVAHVNQTLKGEGLDDCLCFWPMSKDIQSSGIFNILELYNQGSFLSSADAMTSFFAPGWCIPPLL